MKIFQISSEVNIGSVGRIAEQIGENILNENWESYIAYGREELPSKSKVFKIGNKLDVYRHVVYTRLTDKHGYGSEKPTYQLIEKIKEVNPDIIHLQHLHGYYINISILFNYLSSVKAKVVWTFHDCWSFTGHCAYYEMIDCQKWQQECFDCPQLSEYPKSLCVDRSKENFRDKKKLFTSVSNLTIVPVSTWLEGEVKKSFLKESKITTIHNGIDLETFSPKKSDIRNKYNLSGKFIILGVASPWDKRKGLKYFIKLAEKLKDNRKIVLVGLSKKQIKDLPSNIIGLERTKNVSELANLYSAADVFVNPTLEDTFPTTNLEALACGTPVITFLSGGSAEAIDINTGIIVEKGNIEKLIFAIDEIEFKTKEFYSENCRNRAVLMFDKSKSFSKYIKLYKKILAI
ncbi:glycosyltransferase [Chryseobacterium sp. L7]|uniref:Glycosyltransferase n=1 Tax=Chryseobacterium endalhagicum TaxID=2797638 RepID=A0ABS1QCN0_9FLAO|nr:glycosyltransferase [Chryseobacterium endalhagicum]MBL1219834.1 glycosyltransferase [Chryseobacterium endalhagicum]